MLRTILSHLPITRVRISGWELCDVSSYRKISRRALHKTADDPGDHVPLCRYSQHNRQIIRTSSNIDESGRYLTLNYSGHISLSVLESRRESFYSRGGLQASAEIDYRANEPIWPWARLNFLIVPILLALYYIRGASERARGRARERELVRARARTHRAVNEASLYVGVIMVH